MLQKVRVCSTVAALSIAVSAAACAHNSASQSVTSPSAPIASVAASIAGTWKLQSLTFPDSTTVTVSDPSQFTLELRDGGLVALRLDCNRGSGGYTITGATLTLTPLAVTKAYCGSDSLDTQYLRLLGETTTVTARTTSLELASSRGTLRFIR